MKRDSTQTVFLGFVAFLILYVLSIGPAVRLNKRGILSDRWGQTIYAPLIPVIRVPVLREALGWYIELWVPPSSV